MSRHLRPLNTRSVYARTSGDMLIGPDLASEPAMWWFGLDSGAGEYPIGPNGPWTTGKGGISAVTRATALIADPLAQVPWSTTNGRQPRWMKDPMLTRPDLRSGQQIWPHAVRLNRAAFWANVIRSSIWWGMGAVVFAENDDGTPQAGSLYSLHRHGFETTRNDNNQVCFKIGEIEADSEGRFEVGPITWRIIVLRHPHGPIDEDGRTPGVFEMHPQTFGLVNRMNEYEMGTFQSGIPAGYLKSTTPGMTQTQADQIKAKWLAAHGGNRRSIALLNSTTEFHALTMSPVDTALASMKQASLVDIANAFNIDPSLLGGPSGNSSTYGNVTQYYASYRVHTLGRWQTDTEETFGALLPYGEDLRIELDQLLRADTSTRYDQYDKALASGWMTKDEVREKEGLPPLPKELPPPAPVVSDDEGDEE